MGWFSKAKDGFFLSTTTPEGIDRSQYLGVVNGEAIIGANIFRDLFAGIRDIVGGRAASYESVLRQAREGAMKEMIDEATRQGADAVVGDYGNDSIVGGGAADVVYAGEGNDTVDVSASAIAVYVEGNGGNDSILGGMAGGSLYGQGGNDTIE
eukprot:gene43421-biopygen29638